LPSKKVFMVSAQQPIVGIGELLWDLLPAGTRLGGATANFSILTARLGNTAVLVSRVGLDTLGDQALHQLDTIVAGSPFDLTHIQSSPTLPTGTVTVSLDPEGRPCYQIDAPVAWDEITLTPQLLGLAARAAVICYGTLAQRADPSASTIRAFLDAASPACIRVCDINLRMPFCTPATAHWSLQHATILKISDEELPQLSLLLLDTGLLTTEIPHAPTHDDPAALTAWATQAAHTLLAVTPGCRLIAITLGPHGSLLATRTGTYRHPGFPTTVADTIGAGDAFTAGLVHAYLRNSSLEHISTVANLCGSYVASQQGATPKFPADLLATINSGSPTL
jgi:fructokinase